MDIPLKNVVVVVDRSSPQRFVVTDCWWQRSPPQATGIRGSVAYKNNLQIQITQKYNEQIH